MTPDREKLKILLAETITLLCKNGLDFQSEFSIEALIGITLDQNDVFLVSIKETVQSLQSSEEEELQIELSSTPGKLSSVPPVAHNVSDAEYHSRSSASVHSCADVQKNISSVRPRFSGNGGRPSSFHGAARKSVKNREKMVVSSPKSEDSSTSETTAASVLLENDKCEDLISNESYEKRNSKPPDNNMVVRSHEPERKRRRTSCRLALPSRTFDASNESELTNPDDFLAQCKSEPLDIVELDESLTGREDAEMAACKNEMSDFMYNSMCGSNNDPNQRMLSGSNAWYGQNNATSSSAALAGSSWQNEPTSFDQNNQLHDQGFVFTAETTDVDRSSDSLLSAEKYLHSCSLCGKQMKLHRDLQAHMTTKHNVQNGGFMCPVCGSISTYKHNLYRHLRTVHGTKL